MLRSSSRVAARALSNVLASPSANTTAGAAAGASSRALVHDSGGGTSESASLRGGMRVGPSACLRGGGGGGGVGPTAPSSLLHHAASYSMRSSGYVYDARKGFADCQGDDMAGRCTS